MTPFGPTWLPKAVGVVVVIAGLLVVGNQVLQDPVATQQAGAVATTPSVDAPTITTQTDSSITTPPPPTAAAPTTSTTADLSDFAGWVNPESSGRPWSDLGAVEGLLTFRGNPTRTWYGRGPVPSQPRVAWTFDIGCSNSPVGGESKQWCGSGWTGQPAIFHPPTNDSSTNQAAWWLAFGAYNRKVNFLDPHTGAEVLPAYATDDIIKGTITIDPDGFPLLYTGSRDNFYHVVALDRPEPVALWKLAADAVKPTLWNNDWDGSGLIIGDYLFEGGENSRLFIVKLNRAYGPDGLVTVAPEIVFSAAGWDDELLAAVDTDVSIENSVAISGDTLYFANSGGLIQGWDLSTLKDGGDPERVFRFWNGDDTDASIVIDDEGMLYVVNEYERGNARAKELGQVMKLDPSNPDDPLLWSREANSGLDSGVWATPALTDDLVIVATDDGRVLGLDRATGEERWVLDLPGPLWQSPVVVDDVLIQGDCEGWLHAFDLTASPPSTKWSIELGGCIESTPAVWDGWIYVGSRNGTFYALAD